MRVPVNTDGRAMYAGIRTAPEVVLQVYESGSLVGRRLGMLELQCVLYENWRHACRSFERKPKRENSKLFSF